MSKKTPNPNEPTPKEYTVNVPLLNVREAESGNIKRVIKKGDPFVGIKKDAKIINEEKKEYVVAEFVKSKKKEK